MEDASLLNFVRPGGLPYALLILAVAFVLARLTDRTVQPLGRRFADKRLVINQVGLFVRFTIYMMGAAGAAATVLVLRQEVLLAVGGTVAVAIGFAFKDVVGSLIAGLVILVDRPFQVGDRVTFEGYYGEIRSIGLRSVRLMTLDDTLVTIPNNKFLTDAVASGNAGSVEMMIQMDFHIGPDQDVPRAKKIVQEALSTSRYVHLGRRWAVLVSSVVLDNLPAVRLRAKAYVLDVAFEKSFETDVTERVLTAFQEAGIQPPALLHRSV